MRLYLRVQTHLDFWLPKPATQKPHGTLWYMYQLIYDSRFFVVRRSRPCFSGRFAGSPGAGTTQHSEKDYGVSWPVRGCFPSIRLDRVGISLTYQLQIRETKSENTSLLSNEPRHPNRVSLLVPNLQEHSRYQNTYLVPPG